MYKPLYHQNLLVMSTIKIGKSNPKKYSTTGFVVEERRKAPKVLTEEQKEKLLDSIGKMPVENRVAALRSAGLVDEANEYERHLADEQARMLRANRLAEIMAMSEEEQLPLLLAEGFEDEAKELSERLSKAVVDNTDDGDGEKSADANGTTEDSTNVESTGAEESADNSPAPTDTVTDGKKSTQKKSDGKETK